jgi:predicted nucleic acid-binding protein
MTKHTIVGDSSPLIALAVIGQLELLPKLYQQVVIPKKVWEENGCWCRFARCIGG